MRQLIEDGRKQILLEQQQQQKKKNQFNVNELNDKIMKLTFGVDTVTRQEFLWVRV